MNAQNTAGVAKRERESFSANLAVVYVAICAAVVGTFTGLGVERVITNHYDVWFSFMLAGLGWAFRSVGGNKPVIVATTILSAFVMLTFYQAPLVKYLVLAAVLFAMGVYGMCKSRNAVRVLMSIELMLNAVNINLIAFSRYVDPTQLKGQLFAIFILTVAAAEAAVGLAIVLSLYRNTSTVDMDKFNILKW
ncbi:MAG: NADH-quinone oxidoreductase subunit K [bacterium ADurb.Bin425]|jgi:NAD(P)H-quinone oxidoreductase subunit 4L|nr:MAG: NADH-quinone oxidoreductase subunit K [bacterium ADurb.Bin425]